MTDMPLREGPVAIDFAQVCQWSVGETFLQDGAAPLSRRERFRPGGAHGEMALTLMDRGQGWWHRRRCRTWHYITALSLGCKTPLSSTTMAMWAPRPVGAGPCGMV